MMKVVDMHCDTILKLYDDLHHGKEDSLLENDGHIDLKKMQKGNYLLQNFAMFVDLSENPQPFLKANQLINHYYHEIEKYPELIKPVFCYQDIIDHQQAGIMSSLLTLEEGAVVENDLSLLEHYYRLGVRMITLTWNHVNGIGYPNLSNISCYEDMFKINDHDGLTPFGLQYIKEMERLGIIIDVSHLSDAGFYDVYHHTTKPFVASHSNARQVCGVARNMSDDMILKLASRGGVMGINFCSDFLTTEGTHQTSYIKDMVQHILYIKNLAGIDCIGLGSDFDGIGSKLEMKDASGYQMLYSALIEAGLSIEEIEKMLRKIRKTEVYENMIKEYQSLHHVDEIKAREQVDGQLNQVRSFINYDYVKEVDYIDKRINTYYSLYSTRILMVLSNSINMQTYLNDLLMTMKDYGEDERREFLENVSGCFNLQSYKYIGRKSIERRRKRKPNTKSGAILTSSLTEEDKARLTRELLYEYPDRYGVRQAAGYFDELLLKKESVIPDKTIIRTRDDAMMMAAGIIYSGSGEFPFEVDFLDGIIETEVATISKIRIKRKS